MGIKCPCGRGWCLCRKFAFRTAPAENTKPAKNSVNSVLSVANFSSYPGGFVAKKAIKKVLKTGAFLLKTNVFLLKNDAFLLKKGAFLRVFFLLILLNRYNPTTKTSFDKIFGESKIAR